MYENLLKKDLVILASKKGVELPKTMLKADMVNKVQELYRKESVSHPTGRDGEY